MRILMPPAAVAWLALSIPSALLSQQLAQTAAHTARAKSLQPASGSRIPLTHTTALDGHAVDLPANLPGRTTILILGFGRHSADATTAWEKPIRTQLAHSPAIGFYDMAMLAEIPSFARSFVLRSVRKQVPDVLKPNFLPLFDQENAWKQVAGYNPDQPEAAYVLLVDSAGAVRWSTHETFSPAAFEHLRDLAQHLAGN